MLPFHSFHPQRSARASGPPESAPLRRAMHIAWSLVRHPCQGWPSRCEAAAPVSAQLVTRSDALVATRCEVPISRSKSDDHARAPWVAVFWWSGARPSREARNARHHHHHHWGRRSSIGFQSKRLQARHSQCHATGAFTLSSCFIWYASPVLCSATTHMAANRHATLRCSIGPSSDPERRPCRL